LYGVGDHRRAESVAQPRLLRPGAAEDVACLLVEGEIVGDRHGGARLKQRVQLRNYLGSLGLEKGLMRGGILEQLADSVEQAFRGPSERRQRLSRAVTGLLAQREPDQCQTAIGGRMSVGEGDAQAAEESVNLQHEFNTRVAHRHVGG
jgi:hypothetical protein